MTDLIIKKPATSLAEAQARGAIIVNDNEPGQGFAEDDTHDPSYDDPSVLDARKRSEDAQGRNLTSDIQEETLRLREGNTDAVRKFRLNHQSDYIDWVPGRILKLNEFLSLL